MSDPIDSDILDYDEEGGFGRWLATLLRICGVAFLILLVTWSSLARPFRIPSGSMIPTLEIGDHIFVNMLGYGLHVPWYDAESSGFLTLLPLRSKQIISWSQPARGDVIVFRYPPDPKVDYIKRIVGLPGDRLQMIDGVLHINGEPVKLRRIEDAQLEGPDGRMVEVRQYLETLPNGVTHPILKTRRNGPLDNTQEYLVPAHHYFAMGDNRDNSQDSRFSLVGYIPEENLVGRAEFLFFSLEEGTEFWEVWKWPWDVRFDRLFTAVH